MDVHLDYLEGHSNWSMNFLDSCSSFGGGICSHDLQNGFSPYIGFNIIVFAVTIFSALTVFSVSFLGDGFLCDSFLSDEFINNSFFYADFSVTAFLAMALSVIVF